MGRVWVLEEDGKLIFKTDIMADTSDVVYLEGIWVSQTERGKGIGRKCLPAVVPGFADSHEIGLGVGKRRKMFEHTRSTGCAISRCAASMTQSSSNGQIVEEWKVKYLSLALPIQPRSLAP